MSESETGRDVWHKLTEFMVTGEPLPEQTRFPALDAALQVLHLPSALQGRLHAALANAVDRMARAVSKPAVIIHVFVAANDILRDNDYISPAQTLCWSFFLVEKRAAPTGDHAPVRPHLIEVFCYQEGD